VGKLLLHRLRAVRLRLQVAIIRILRLDTLNALLDDAIHLGLLLGGESPRLSLLFLLLSATVLLLVCGVVILSHLVPSVSVPSHFRPPDAVGYSRRSLDGSLDVFPWIRLVLVLRSPITDQRLLLRRPTPSR